MPTREDVLAIRSIEDAFDFLTPRVTKREVALVRVALDEDLIAMTLHAYDALEDEMIPEEYACGTIRHGRARSKDRDAAAGRSVGLNFENTERLAVRPLRVKVSWEVEYFIATVHTL